MTITIRALAAMLPVLFAVSVASGAPTPLEKCEASKLKALGKAQKATITCYSKEQANAAFDEVACRDKLLEKLAAKLTKAGSVCAGVYAECEERIDTCAPAVAGAGPTGSTKCEASKRKAVGKYAAAVLKCRAGDDVLACTAKAAGKLTGALAKAEEDGACSGLESTLVEAVTDHCIDNVAPAGDPIPICEGCADASDCAGDEFCSAGLCADDTCTPGELSCNGDSLEMCGADGGTIELVAECTVACLSSAPYRPACECATDDDCYDGTSCVFNVCKGEPESCLADPPPASLPATEIQWGGSGTGSQDATGSPFPASSQVGTTPIVANLDDDNEDGAIDGLDYPEIVFLSYCASEISTNGIVRAIHGGGPDKGADYFASCGPTVWHEGDDVNMACACSTATANSTSAMAVGDLDADGVPEIVVASETAGLIILDNTGEPITQTGTFQWSGYVNPAVALANLDGEGFVEIVVGRHVFTLGHDVGNNLVFVDRFEGTLMHGMQGQGPIPCVADVDGDSRPDIVAGTTVYSFPEPPSGVSKIADCMVGATDDFCLGRLTVLWDGQTVNGAVAIPNAQRDGFCAVADVLGADQLAAPGPDNALDGTPEVVLINEGYFLVLDGQTGTLRRMVNLSAGADGGAPTIADTDGDGFPEVASAFGSQFVLIDLQDPSTACPAWPTAFVDGNPTPPSNPDRVPGTSCSTDSNCADGAVCRSGECVCLHNGWKRTTEDDSSRTTSSAAFDFDGDGRSELVYNDECFLRIYDGSSSSLLFKHSSPNRTRIEGPSIADGDGDGRAEIILSSNNESPQCSGGINYPNGVAMWGDLNDAWRPTRPIWNQHTYHVTNVNDDGSIPLVETPSWLPHGGWTDNAYRSNPPLCEAEQP